MVNFIGEGHPLLALTARKTRDRLAKHLQPKGETVPRVFVTSSKGITTDTGTLPSNADTVTIHTRIPPLTEQDPEILGAFTSIHNAPQHITASNLSAAEAFFKFVMNPELPLTPQNAMLIRKHMDLARELRREELRLESEHDNKWLELSRTQLQYGDISLEAMIAQSTYDAITAEQSNVFSKLEEPINKIAFALVRIIESDFRKRTESLKMHPDNAKMLLYDPVSREIRRRATMVYRTNLSESKTLI